MLGYCLDFCAELFDKWGERLIFIGLAGEGDIAGYNHDYMVYLVWNLSQARSHGRSRLERGRGFKVDITDMEYYESHVFPLLACCIHDIERGPELPVLPTTENVAGIRRSGAQAAEG